MKTSIEQYWPKGGTTNTVCKKSQPHRVALPENLNLYWRLLACSFLARAGCRLGPAVGSMHPLPGLLSPGLNSNFSQGPIGSIHARLSIKKHAQQYRLAAARLNARHTLNPSPSTELSQMQVFVQQHQVGQGDCSSGKERFPAFQHDFVFQTLRPRVF